jgi:hypothetical protein
MKISEVIVLAGFGVLVTLVTVAFTGKKQLMFHVE